MMKIPALNFLIAIILAAVGLLPFAGHSFGMNIALFIGLCTILSLINASILQVLTRPRRFVPAMIAADVLAVAMFKIIDVVWYY